MSWRLFGRIVGQEVRTRLSYRVDFWLNAIVGFLAQFGLVYFVWQAMFRESGAERIGGYSFEEMVVYYLTVVVLGRWWAGATLDGQVSTDIYEGGINRYLLFPAPYLPFKYAQQVGGMIPSAVPYLVLGGVFVATLDLPADSRPTLGSVAMAIPVLALANLLHFLIGHPIQLVSFWADNVWSLEVAKRFLVSFLGGALLPLDGVPEAGMQDIALSWLPFSFLFFHFPARVLLGHVSPVGEWALGVGMCAGGLRGPGSSGPWISWRVWRRGQLTSYSGIGI